MSDTYKMASELAKDFAEDYIRSEMADSYIPGSVKKAKEIRAMSEKNTDQFSESVQRFRFAERVLYGSFYKLIEGSNGYKLSPTPPEVE